jgi:hypothetical protein
VKKSDLNLIYRALVHGKTFLDLYNHATNSTYKTTFIDEAIKTVEREKDETETSGSEMGGVENA